MALSIISVKGVGGTPPAILQITITVTSCETVRVTTSCSSVFQDFDASGQTNPGTWIINMPNDTHCGCGTDVKVTAKCINGSIEEDANHFPIICDTLLCPSAHITLTNTGNCDATTGKRLMTFQAVVTPSSGMPAVGEWRVYTFPNSPTNNPTIFTQGPSVYVPASGMPQPPLFPISLSPTTLGQPYTVCIHWSNPPHTNCAEATFSFEVPPCSPPCCPNLKIVPSPVRDCVSQNPEFSFTVSSNNSCPPPQNNNYVWTVSGPTGQYQLSPAAITVNTSSPNWKNLATNVYAPIDLSQVGIYTIGIGFLNGNTVNCIPATSAPFEVIACCPPGQYWVAQQHACISCPTLTIPQVPITGCSPNGNAAASFSTTISPASAASFKWEVTAPNGDVFTKTTSTPSTTDGITDGTWLSSRASGPLNLNRQGAYVVKVTAKGKSISDSCSVSKTIGFTIPPCACPPGQHLDATGKCVPDCPPGQHLDASGKCVPDCPPGQHWDAASGKCVTDIKPPVFDICALLLLLWLLGFVATGVLFFLGLYKVGLLSLLLFVVFFLAWIVVCCQNFCSIMKWLFIATSWVTSILGIIGLAAQWLKFIVIPNVAFGYSTLLTIILIILGIANCGLLPNPFGPNTWPPSTRCPKPA